MVLQGPGDVEIARYTASRGPRRGGSGPRWICRYYEALANEFAIPAPATGSEPVMPVEGQTYAFVCVDADSGAVTRALFRTYDPADPFGGVLGGLRAAEIAVDQIPLPDPDLRVSPPATAFSLVGVPTWFWVTDPWEPMQATASVGAVAATVTATPRTLVVDTGDGTAVTCSGPGVVWTEGASSTCTHTYTWSSRHQPGGHHEVTATVTWDVAWTATDGDGGDLGQLTRSTTVAITVLEAQAVSD